MGGTDYIFSRHFKTLLDLKDRVACERDLRSTFQRDNDNNLFNPSHNFCCVSLRWTTFMPIIQSHTLDAATNEKPAA